MRRATALVLIFIIISCNNSSYVPSDIIRPKQMQDIFWDMIRGDLLAQEVIKKDSTQNIKTASFAITEKILKIHKTDRAEFEKSMAFYEKHPVLMKTILDSLNAAQTRKNFYELNLNKKNIKGRDHHIPNPHIIK